MPDPAPLDAALDRFAAQLREAALRVDALAAGLDDRGFNARPAPGAWSAGECLVHLNRVAKGFAPAVERAVGRAPARPAAPAPLRYRINGRVFVAISRPGSRPIPTLPTMRPPAAGPDRSELDRDRAVASFHTYHGRLLAAVERARGVDVGRAGLWDPFVPGVRLPLAAVLDGLGLHALRHVAQAERAALVTRPASDPS